MKTELVSSVITILLTLMVCVGNVSAQTPFADLANSLQPGTWAELATTNISPTLSNTGGASNNIFGFTDNAVWDSVSKNLFYVGGDHSPVPCYPRFVSFTESTNTWQILSQPSWFPCTTGTAMHGYDHSAVDVVGRKLYHRPYNGTVVRKYDITTQTWSDLPSIPTSVMGYNNCCVGVEWFPERQSLIYVSLESGSNGSVAEYRESTGQWTRIGPGSNLPMGAYHHFAEYNPVHHIVLFGGGNGSQAVYKLTPAGQITRMQDAPVGVGIQASIITVDPVSGDYLVFTSNNYFYSYNVITDVWTLISSGGTSVPIWTTGYGNSIHGVVAAPVSNYGVTTFVTCNFSACKVNLYKHSNTPPPSDTTPPTVSLTAPAAGSTATGSITVSANAADNVGVVGVQFKLDGVGIGSEDLTSPYSITWDSTTTSNGSHSLTATARDASGNQTTSASVAITVSNAPPPGGETFKASTDFSSTQGYRNWYYRDSSGNLMTYDSGNVRWQGNETFMRIFVDGAHPGNVSDAVRRWTVPSAGSVNITGNAYDGHSGCGQGVTVYILKNNTTLWTQNIVDGNTTGFSYNLTQSVVAGDNIDFVVNRGSDNVWDCDTTLFDPTIIFSSGSGDTTPPTVTMTAPMNGSTVVGSVTVSADASDNVGVVGVQFKLDGNNLGSEDLTLPYSLVWNSTTTTNANHSVSAVARDAAGNSTTAAAVNITVNNAPPPPNPGMPSLDDEKATYTRWGWTWNPSIEPNYSSAPGYTVSDPDIHGDTEGDDLWTYLNMYRRTDQQGYLDRANAWAVYFKSDYRQCVGTTGRTFCYDRDAFGADHIYGYGLVDLYLYNGDPVALVEAQNLGAVLETLYAPNSPFGCLPNNACVHYGTRQVGRHLNMVTRLAEVTGSSRWITLRDQIINLLMNNTTEWSTVHGFYFWGEFNTDTVQPGLYASGTRIASPFETGVLAEGLWRAYKATGRTDIRDRLVAMSRFVQNRGLDATMQYTGSRFGVNSSGQTVHYFLTDPVYTTDLTNLLVIGYKLTGDTTLLDRARVHFNRGTKGEYGTGARLAGDTEVHHFIDTRFASATGNFYLDYNKGELLYTYLIFENGGLPTIEGAPPPPPDITPPTVTMTAPANGATVSNTITVSANATDLVGVVGVQFKLNGSNLGAEDTTTPYSVAWDTLSVSNGSHALTATARDTAGNVGTATAVSVTVNNTPPPPPNVCVTTPLTVTVSTWPNTSAGSNRTFRYTNSQTIASFVVDMSLTRATFTDVRGCTLVVNK